MAWIRKTKIESPSIGWTQNRRAERRSTAPGLSNHDDPLPLPDLLHLDERFSLDPEKVERLLELSFLGKEGARGLDRIMIEDSDSGSWQSDLFAADLFLDELIRSSFRIEIEGIRFPVNQPFLRQTLASPPTSPEAIAFRQEILRELDDEPQLLEASRSLYRQVSVLLDMFKAPDHTAQLDVNTYRLDILRQAKAVIDQMVAGFADARSGLQRLHEKGSLMAASSYYERLAALLDFESCQSTLTVSLNIGPDGEVKDLQLLDQTDNVNNPFYQSLTSRWWLRLKSAALGHSPSQRSIVQRILHRVFEEVSPALVPLVQISAHLELYLAAIGFRERLLQAGLQANLAELGLGRAIRLRGLANPLLLDDESPPVPCDIELDRERTLTLITGPNSGGKTRLLQSLGLAQLLAQSGIFVPAAHAEMPIVRGMFVSLVETETADQAEGRLGRELLRIRNLFAHVGSPALVILDELCSGTNPAEGVEIFSLVLQLLERMGAGAFISTHFLDFVHELEQSPTTDGLRFLQVEPAGEGRSTYQFITGTASSSLAKETAQRLGVTFEDLSRLIDRRLGLTPETAATLPEGLAPNLRTDRASR